MKAFALTDFDTPPDVEEAVPLDAAPRTFEAFTTGHTMGKIVVAVDG
jgi:NADPH-dependent curcumin reductase CurA